MKKIIGFTLFCLLALSFTPLQARIKIYGHRGTRGLAPENTIPAYKAALRIGIDYADMDVNMTKDGVVVVAHNYALNPDLTRGPDGHWISNTQKIFIKDLTFKQLQQYDVGRLNPSHPYAEAFPDQIPVDGTHISSLKQVIEYVNKVTNNSVNFQVEIKTDPGHPDWTFSPEKIAKATVKVLKETGVDTRTDLQAFDWRVLLEVQKADPNIATAYLTKPEISHNMSDDDPHVAGLWSAGYLLKNYDNSIPKMIASLGGKVWGAEESELTPALVNEAHQYGLRVVPWTVDTPAEMRRMIKIGVDGIITDRPDIARGIVSSEGIQVPHGFTVR